MPAKKMTKKERAKVKLQTKPAEKEEKQEIQYTVEDNGTEFPKLTRLMDAYGGWGTAVNVTIDRIADMAEPEIWGYDGKRDFLLEYIQTMVFKAAQQDKIMYNLEGTYCALNTGLITPAGEPVLIGFNNYTGSEDAVNSEGNQYYWHLLGAITPGNKMYSEEFGRVVPEIPVLYQNYRELWFDPDKEVIVNSQHIVGDNIERVKALAPDMPDTLLIPVTIFAVDKAVKNARRNPKCVIPYWYETETIQGHIAYAIPVQLDFGAGNNTMILATEDTGAHYRVSTLLPIEAVYVRARLLHSQDFGGLATYIKAEG